MSKVRKADFYYGAVLSVIFNNKNDGHVTPAMIDGDDERRIYSFTTDNTEFKLFIKLSKDKKSNQKADYSS